MRMKVYQDSGIRIEVSKATGNTHKYARKLSQVFKHKPKHKQSQQHIAPNFQIVFANIQIFDLHGQFLVTLFHGKVCNMKNN